jgi:hypothetical protein
MPDNRKGEREWLQRASDSHPPGQLDDSRGSMPNFHVTRAVNRRQGKTGDESKLRPPSPKIPVAAMIRTHGMSQNLRPPSGGERPSMSWAIKQKTGHGSELAGNTNFDLMKAVFMQRHK